MDFVFKAMRRVGAPPAFSRAAMEVMASTPPLPANAEFAEPFFTRAISKNGQRLPQAIAHRGYKAKFPENTMAAFKSAVEVGVQALETDVHLTSDGVVVLGHDATLARCFGVDKKIIECDWEFLSGLRTLKEPHEPMPRLEDLVKYLAQPEAENTWLLLDIKLDNAVNDIMRAMADVFRRVPPRTDTRWQDRVVLGCWAANFMPAAVTHLPSFPITNIGFSIQYSRQFLTPQTPCISFNMLLAALVTPLGRKFIRKAKAENRAVYAWTVNDKAGWEWCIQHRLDGVISDDPKAYLEYLEEREKKDGVVNWGWKDLQKYLKVALFVHVFEILYWFGWGYGGVVKQLMAEKKGAGRG